MAFEDHARAELARLDAAGLRRGRRVVAGRQGVDVVVDGRTLINFSANDYLGLAGHAALETAAAEALKRSGVGAGASRLIVGNNSEHQRLELSLGQWLERDVVVFNSGFAANTGVLPVLAGRGDVIVSDELNHASIIDGCRLSRADVAIYRHLDLGDLERTLAADQGKRIVIVTESVFSMDG